MASTISREFWIEIRCPHCSSLVADDVYDLRPVLGVDVGSECPEHGCGGRLVAFRCESVATIIERREAS